VPAALAKALCRERRLSRHENLTDSDVRLGGFRHAGFAALMQKLACRVWRRISLPDSFPFTGSSTPLLGSHLSTPLFFRPGNLDLAVKLAASLSEDTTSGGFGSGLLLRTSHV
jgi:hypothetical protein